MTRVLLPRLGKGRKVLGGVVFTDGAAEVTLGPSIRRLFEARGAALIGTAEELDEHTVDELQELADRGGIHLPSHLRKADIIRVLLGGSPVDHEDEAKGSQIVDVEPTAGDDDEDEDGDEPTSQEPAAAPPATEEAAPTEIAPETSAQHPEEGTTWQPSPPSTTSATTTGSLSLQERRRQHSQDS